MSEILHFHEALRAANFKLKKNTLGLFSNCGSATDTRDICDITDLDEPIQVDRIEN